MQALLSLCLALQESAPAGNPAAAPQTSLLDLAVPFGGILLIFYFLMWRPQARERRQREGMLAEIKKGDKVMTTSGMYATVASVSEKDVVLKVDDKTNLRLRFSRQSVQTVLGAKDGGDEKE